MAESNEIQRLVETVGLMALGFSGPWEVAIDATTEGPQRWFAQIEGPCVYLYFEIPSPDVVGKTIEFLAPQQAASGDLSTEQAQPDSSLAMSKEGETPVSLVRDDECRDRYFLVVGPTDRSVVRLTLADQDLVHIAAALRDAQEDMEDSE